LFKVRQELEAARAAHWSVGQSAITCALEVHSCVVAGDGLDLRTMSA
jgi:hypothetical protein